MEEREDAQGYEPMTNDEYRSELKKLFDGIEDNDLLEYFYYFCKGKVGWYYGKRD